MGVETPSVHFPNGAVSRPSWYYAQDGEQKGPVSAEDFDRLVAAGLVTATTQVWSEGMANWQPWAEVRPPTPAPVPMTPPPPVAAVSSQCALCGIGVTDQDSVHLDGRLVCAACKPRAVQMLREGVSSVDAQAEQIWRDHISHEASIRSVGSLQILGGAIFGLLGIGSIIGLGVGAASGAGSSGAPVVVMMAGMSAFYLVGAVFLPWVGFGSGASNPRRALRPPCWPALACWESRSAP